MEEDNNDDDEDDDDKFDLMFYKYLVFYSWLQHFIPVR
jgi:hypothetical protein